MQTSSARTKKRFTRRGFLSRAASTSLGLAYCVPSSVFGANAPSERINLGIIGTGNQGFIDMQGFLQNEDCRIVSVCDVNNASFGYKTEKQFRGREPARQLVNEHYARQQRSGHYTGCTATAEFRQVLARADVDAVVIVVPDHWHAIMAKRAARAGKHIYCEKPMTLTVAQGRSMVRTVRRSGVVFQTGSHERSNQQSRFACALVRNGRIGQVKRITAIVGPHNKTGPSAAWTPMPIPKGFDYNMWLGPAPRAPYHEDRCFYKFRFLLDYSGGQTTNYGAHSLDLAQWGNNTEYTGPIEFEDQGSVFPQDGLFDAPTHIHFRGRYANGVELICKTGPENVQVRFEGTEGWVQTGYRGFTTNPASLKQSTIGAQEIQLYQSQNHYRNFLDCIKSGRQTAAPVEVGHRSATVCHLGNIAMRLKQKIQWDPVQERITNNDMANRLLDRAQRFDWDRR
jgi:predicted dehydrogenase